MRSTGEHAYPPLSLSLSPSPLSLSLPTFNLLRRLVPPIALLREASNRGALSISSQSPEDESCFLEGLGTLAADASISECFQFPKNS